MSQVREQAAAMHVIRATPALSPPLRPPRLVVRQRSSGVDPGYIFIAPKQGQTAQGPEIVDEQGRPVWFQPGGDIFFVNDCHNLILLCF